MCTETETCNLFVGCVDINIKCNNETNPIQECDLLVHAAMGFVVLQIFTLIFISLLCLYRYRRLSKYEIQNIMDKSTDSPNQFQELQLIRSEELEENIDFLPESMKENTNHKVHGKQTHDYSRVYFPKFKIVDTPADEYSKTIISRQQVDEHKRKIVYSKDQDKVNMQSTIFFYRTT
ncbi:uncharacterized protein LOC133191466 isoform X2 [Saccostrea echinata]|uniref:uncharacterized protein LOC133191466 isoform X2 n=1 Tax=Saccostrea echinata TaxID=191078 RepID=UPI002A841086|nr:uncharacterized protein LOC133191466 isoform X2 [Saccostrea echinata]